MPSQPTLRPFDVAVLLRLLLEPESRYEPLAAALVTSTSAVHRSVARLQLAGLCQPSSRTVHGTAARDFLMHGIRYAFPVLLGAERAGMPTAIGHPAVRDLVADAESATVVWPTESGTVRGASLTPLFPGVPAVAQRDARMYELLALVDAVRMMPQEHARDSAVAEALAARLAA